MISTIAGSFLAPRAQSAMANARRFTPPTNPTSHDQPQTVHPARELNLTRPATQPAMTNARWLSRAATKEPPVVETTPSARS